jgi:hypothetical protein
MKIVKRAAVLAFAMFVVAVFAVSAVAPSVVNGTATVDGSSAEWNPSTGGPDFFSPMCTGFKCDSNHPVVANLFLRYACATQTMYVLVLATAGNTFNQGTGNFVAVNTEGNKVVDPSSGNIGPPPNFEYLGNGQGWEASFTIAPGSFNIWFESTVNGATGGTPGKFIPVDPGCSSTAVTVSSMSAHVLDDGAGWAILGLGALGIVTLGSVVFVIARKR